MTDKHTPEQNAAMERIEEAIQAAALTFDDPNGGEHGPCHITDWVVVAAGEYASGPVFDDDGDMLTQFFNISRREQRMHVSRGLIEHGRSYWS